MDYEKYSKIINSFFVKNPNVSDDIKVFIFKSDKLKEKIVDHVENNKEGKPEDMIIEYINELKK